MSTYAMCGALHDAVRRGNLDEVHNLVQAGADVKARATMGVYSNVTPLEVAKAVGWYFPEKRRNDVIEYLEQVEEELNH